LSTSTRVTGLRKHLAGVLGVAFIFVLWQAAAWALPDFLMPGVPTVVSRLVQDLGQSDFHQSLLGTLGRRFFRFAIRYATCVPPDGRHRAET